MLITEKMLGQKVKSLNVVTGNPVDNTSRDQNGKPVYNIGNFHIHKQMSGYSLHQVINERGGVTDVFYRTTKKELFGLVDAYIKGYKQAIEDQKLKEELYG